MAILTPNLNRHERTPLYYQLYQFIVGEIRAGSLREGEKMPSKRALSDHLKISQNTVDTAYQMLVTEGYLRAAAKSGFYVCRVEAPLFHTPSDIPPAEPEPAPPQYEFDFSTNTMAPDAFPYATWAKITKEIMYHQRELLQQGHGQGDLCLRESIAKYLHEFRGVRCSPAQLVVGAGMEYLLTLICQLLGPKAIFAIENPGYPKTCQTIRNCGREVCFLDVEEHGMSLEQLRNSRANVAYLTPSHQFPTGVVMPVGPRTGLLQWAGQSPDRYLIEDDYDSEFKFSARPVPAMQGLLPGGRVLYIGTFSRSIAPSVRIAYMVLPHSLLGRYQELFRHYSSTVSRFEQHTLHRFLSGGHLERHLNRMKNSYRKSREALLSAWKNSPLAPHIQILGANAGLHCLLQVRGLGSEAHLLGRAREAGVLLKGLSSYCFAPPAKPWQSPTLLFGYARLSCEQIQEAVNRLSEVWLL